MQGLSQKAFMQMLNAAVSCGMPKLLACCEYYIAADPLDRFGLSSLLSMEGSLPERSTMRITAALRLVLKDSDCCRSYRDTRIDRLQKADAFYKMAQSGQQPCGKARRRWEASSKNRTILSDSE